MLFCYYILYRQKTPQGDQTKDKSSDSEEKEYKTKSKHGRNKVEMDENGKPYNTGRWTDEEHRRFMEGIEIYGKDWKKVQQHVGTRSSAQSRSHAQKVLAKSYYSKSLSAEYSWKQEWIQGNEDIEKWKVEKIMDKKMDGIKELNKIKTPIPSPKKSPIVAPPYFRRRIDFSIEDNIERLASNNFKRKCTIDISKYDNEHLIVEDDELSNKLLRKLTTPEPTAKLMSFSYNDLPRLNFNLDSDSESLIEDDFFFN